MRTYTSYASKKTSDTVASIEDLQMLMPRWRASDADASDEDL
jgi:hypothetical protein